MALKLSAASDSMVAAAANHTVFIDTSLDTHLAMLVSDLDTVSDLKRKIEKEHTLCFTNIGQIVVHALKVKRQSHLYHLPDCMFVKDVLDRAKKNWFLSADASIVEKHDEKQLVHNPESNNLLTCLGLISNTLADGIDLPPNDIPEQGASDANKKTEVPQVRAECKSDVSKRNGVEQCDMSVEETSESNQVAKRKHKIEHLQEENIGSAKETSKLETVSQKLDLSTKSDASKRKGLERCDMLVEEASQSNQDVKRKRKIEHFQEENIHSVEETSKPEIASQKLDLSTNSDASKRDILEQYNISVEETLQSEQVAKRKHKTEHLQEENIGSVKETSKPEIVSQKFDLSTKSDASKRDVLEQCNMSVEEALQSDQVAKSKRKIEHLQEEIIHSVKETSKPEIVSQHYSGDKENRENATLDGLSAKPVDDDHLVINSSKRKKRKKVRKLGEKLNQVVDGVPPSGKDVLGEHYKDTTEVDPKDSGREPDTICVPVQGEHGVEPPELCRISLKEKCSDIVEEAGKYVLPVVDVGNKSKASVEEATCAANEMLTSNNYCPVDVESNPTVIKEPDDQQMDDGVSGHKNSETRQAEKRAVKERASSKKGRKQSNNPDSRSEDTTEVRIQNANVTADLLGESGTVVPTNSSKTRKSARKTKDSVGKTLVISGREDSERPEPLEANYSEQPGNKARKEESILSQRHENEKGGLEINIENTLLAKENDDVTGNEVKAMQQTSKHEGKAENVEKQVRKESKRKRKLSEKNLPDSQQEDRNIVDQNSTQPSDNKSDVVASSNSKKKGRLEKPARRDQLIEEKLESKNYGAEIDPVPAQQNSEFAKSKVQSHSIDQSHQARPVEAHPTKHPPESGHADEANSQIKISEVSNKVNLEKQLPEVVASSGVVVDKMTRAKRAANILNFKNIKNDVHSDRTSSDLQSSPKSNDKQGIKGKLPARNTSTDPLSKNKSDESTVHPEKKQPKASRNGAKAPASNVSDNKLISVPEETRRHNVANAAETNIHSEKNTDFVSVSKSSSQRSGIMTSSQNVGNKQPSGDRKVSNEDNGKIMKSSQQGKKLLATPGSIFNDDGGESSEDEEGSGSDASDRTPADDSASSDISDGEDSNAKLNSTQNGPINSGKTISEGRIGMKSCATNMELGDIIRKSSGFKKAEKTASQLQLEDESQDFVPDSQADQ